MAKEIDFYLDFSSPYAYLAATQIETLAVKHNAQVTWRPFLIGATFKVTGRKAPIQHPLVGDYMIKDVQRFAKLLGLTINFPIKFPILSVKPARLFYYLQERDGNQTAAKAFALKVFQAYFVDRQDFTSNKVLATLIKSFDVSETQVDEAVKSEAMKTLFKSVVDQAIQRGVFGAPIFIVDEEMFWGVDRLDHLDQWLKTGGW